MQILAAVNLALGHGHVSSVSTENNAQASVFDRTHFTTLINRLIRVLCTCFLWRAEHDSLASIPVRAGLRVTTAEKDFDSFFERN